MNRKERWTKGRFYNFLFIFSIGSILRSTGLHFSNSLFLFFRSYSKIRNARRDRRMNAGQENSKMNEKRIYATGTSNLVNDMWSKSCKNPKEETSKQAILVILFLKICKQRQRIEIKRRKEEYGNVGEWFLVLPHLIQTRKQRSHLQVSCFSLHLQAYSNDKI